MRKTVLLILSICLIFSLCACEYVSQYNENGNEANVSSMTDSAASEPKEILSPESAVNIYMLNRDVWMEIPESMPMQGYGYCLLDLNFDGVLELISSVNDGSGRYSYNTFFGLNVEKQTVEEIQHQPEQYDIGADYYLMSERSKLLQNQDTGKRFYLFQDFERISYDEGIVSYSETYMKDGKLCAKNLFSEYTYTEYSDTTYEEIKEYSFQGNIITESEYVQKTSDFYNKNTDLNLHWECIAGSAFDGSSFTQQKQMLLDAYKSFSYDGFSFDDVETYDIEFKQFRYDPEKAKKYTMADYNGMTINDVTELWGADYTLMDGLISGGWGGIYYEDKRCPFVFCFSASMPPRCSGNEVLAGIEVYPQSSDNGFFVSNNINLVCSYAEVSQKISGEYYINELYGGYSYLCELENGDIILFTWIDDDAVPYKVGIDFNITS